MTIKTKLSLNVIIVLSAIVVVILVALTSSQTIKRNIDELTQKTTPYQLAALNQQRIMQAHATNLLTLSSSRTIEEYQHGAPVAAESLGQVDKASAEMMKLKAERSTDKTISEITKSISEITERKIKAQDEAEKASKSIQARLSEASQKMTQLDSSVRDLQQKTSGAMVKGVNDLMGANQQYNHLVAVRDVIKDLIMGISKMPSIRDKQALADLKENISNTINGINQTHKNVKGTSKTVNDIITKLVDLNERMTGGKGIAPLQLKYISEGDEKQKENIDSLTKGAVQELNALLPTIEKDIKQANIGLLSDTGNISLDINAFNNTSVILSLASGLNLVSTSLVTHIDNCIHSKNMGDFDSEVSKVGKLFEEANKMMPKLNDLLTKGGNFDEITTMLAYTKAISAVKGSFLGKEGVAEKVKMSLKNVEDLEKLNNQMKNVVAKYLEQGKTEISQAGANQETAVTSLNQAAKRTVELITLIGGLIVLITLIMGIGIGRSISKAIYRVIEGLTDGAEQVASASNQVSSASQSLAERTSEQAAGIEETSSSIEEMSSMTKQNASNANQANLLITDTGKVVDEANHAMKDLIQSMNEISSASEETGKIIKTIDEIAFQTNLLALNAAVEAARAGEAGAGFAVVADEVRNLALRAADAARNTGNLIEDTIKKIRNGSDITARTNEAFNKVATGSKKVGDLVGEIAAASQEQAQGIEQINKAIGAMDKMVQKNAASAEESASASEEMNAQAEMMKTFVDDLVKVVGGSGNGVKAESKKASPGKHGNDNPSIPAAPHKKTGIQKAALPPTKPGANGSPRKSKGVNPNQVIPMDEPDFKEF
jgi:methyl-accepting chemotaxis protein